MSTDKRSVTTDALETLGSIIDENAGRDAIHLAVEPAVAACTLRPGEDVGFVDGGVGVCENPVGIVDPFLKTVLHKGDRFWLVVYPRQITSLRHVWTHPAFEGQPEPTIEVAPVNASEQWIRNFANSVDLTYNVLMEGAADWVRSKEAGGYSEYLCFGGLLEGVSVPDKFWPHYEIVTGKKVEEDHRGSFFTCSC